MSTMRRRCAMLLILAAAGCGQRDASDSPPPAARAREAMAAKPVQPAAPRVNDVARAPAPVETAKAVPDDACRNNCGAEVAVKADERVAIDVGASPSLGPANAPVTIVVFTDFQCPYCAKLEKRLAEIVSTYGSSVRIAFKNRPLPFHEAARPAALAALAAAEQGKFWEYKEALFTHQTDLEPASLEKYAADVGLNLGRFRTAIDSSDVERALEDDIALADRLEVKGTPTFFVNGRRITGAQPFETCAKLIDEELGR